MLSIIDQKGPHTEGIFRKRGNWKSCIALKEKLNSGHQVDWKRQSAFVVATTLMVGKMLALSIHHMDPYKGFPS